MTEQEKREKAIEDAKLELKTRCAMFFGKIDYETAAIALVNAGYRKEEEVRKETAKEIFTKLIDACSFDGHTVNLYQSRIAEFAKQYGVEVEQ